MHPDLTELSGMASSLRHQEVFWMINDSGHGPRAYAVDREGSSLGVWPLDARANDWEDLTSIQINGEPYLMVADIGDNGRKRSEYRVYVVPEPHIQDINSESDTVHDVVSPITTIRFMYPDGPHNAEAMATDGEWLYIMTKTSDLRPEHSTNAVYRLPVNLVPDDNIVQAEYMGQLPVKTQPAGNTSGMCGISVKLAKPTALEIDNNNGVAYILTYSNVIRVVKQQHQTWSDVLLAGGEPIHYHQLAQAEALTIDNDGKVWFTSENANAPLWVLPSPR